MFRPGSLGGGPYNGFSPKQTINTYKNMDDASTRRQLRDSWNTANALGTINNYNRVITPFRAVNNLGDFLSRKNYNSGGSNQVNADKPGYKSRIGTLWTNTDSTGIPAYSGNPKFVSDSSDYIKFKRQQAANKTYNDLSNGGDDSNGSYVAIMRVRV